MILVKLGVLEPWWQNENYRYSIKLPGNIKKRKYKYFARTN